MDRTQGHYRDAESLSPEAQKEQQFKAVQALVEKAYATSDEFKARMDEAGLKPADIQSLDDYSKIPPLRKKDLIAGQQSKGLDWFLGMKPGQLRRIYQSPGPIYDPESRTPDYWGWAEAFYACGFRPEDLVQNTFSYHLTPAGIMLEEPLQEIGCGVIPAGPGNTDVQMQLLTDLPVNGFVGMTSYLKVIGQKAQAKGLDLSKDINLDVAFVAAERLPESLRNEVQDMFGMLVRQGYGTADVGCIAYECQELGGMHVSTRAYVEICDPATGEPLPMGEIGEVVVTPYVDAYPLVRLATGDLSRMVDDPCACGRTTPKLAGILGRADDTAKVKGQFIYPSQVAEVVASFEAINRHQIVVTNEGGRDLLTVLLELGGELDEAAFVTAFQGRAKLRPVMKVVDAGTIPENAPALIDDRKYD